MPTYAEAVRRVGIEVGQRVLEIGCGSGVFLRLAADRGASVQGLDASEALLEIARRRVPDADLQVGDMQTLPYEDDFFDLVAGFNSFLFADDMVAALREAERVANAGAPVVIQVWGRPDQCALEAMKIRGGPSCPYPTPRAARLRALGAWCPRADRSRCRTETRQRVRLLLGVRLSCRRVEGYGPRRAGRGPRSIGGRNGDPRNRNVTTGRQRWLDE